MKDPIEEIEELIERKTCCHCGLICIESNVHNRSWLINLEEIQSRKVAQPSPLDLHGKSLSLHHALYTALMLFP